MKQFFVLCALLATTCSATYLHGGVSTQYASLDPHSHSYAYGYADPNSQKHETRSHDGVTRGSYSYVDGHGLLQSVSYVADPHHGFQAVGTNLPKAPIAAAVAVGPVAHYAAPVAHYAAGHAYPQAHIVLDHKGVPVDTPEVQHAKAAHAAAYAAAAAGSAHGGHHLYKRSVWGAGYGHGGGAYAGHAANIVLGPGGVPVDTPDVQIAKAEHAAAHSKALSAAVHAGAGAGHGAGAAGYGGAYAGAGGHGGGLYSGAHGYHVPVITHQGVPVETPEVQHAKSAHFAAVAKAAAESGASGHDDGSYHGDGGDGGYGGAGAGAGAGAYGGHAGAYAGHAGAGAGIVGPAHYTAAIQHGGAGAGYGAGYGGGYKGPLHYPVLKNGVPLEPAEVQHARAAHLSALASESAKAAAHGGYYGAHYAKW